jgi:hypothetical protein
MWVARKSLQESVLRRAPREGESLRHEREPSWTEALKAPCSKGRSTQDAPRRQSCSHLERVRLLEAPAPAGEAPLFI